MTGIRINSTDRLDVEMVRELRKIDKSLVIFGMVVGYMYVRLNHRIFKLKAELQEMKKESNSKED